MTDTAISEYAFGLVAVINCFCSNPSVKLGRGRSEGRSATSQQIVVCTGISSSLFVCVAQEKADTTFIHKCKKSSTAREYLHLLLNKNRLELCFLSSDFLLSNLDFVDPTLKCLNLPVCNFMPSSKLQNCLQTSNITSCNAVPRKTEFIPQVILNTLNNILVCNKIPSKQPFYLNCFDQKDNLTSVTFMYIS